ncbi:MAG: transposase, family, partial [Chthoniobacteraceae bacterium]|nr:transposase, family [Chthoniobacteraceae bacterium]
KGENSRRRIFTPAVTFWAFLTQVLTRGSSCRDALRRIQAWWRLEDPTAAAPSNDTSAYCAARLRLNDHALNQISSHLAGHLESNVSGSDLWKNRAVKIVDGTGVSMPDTTKNQEEWPQSAQQKPGCGFPTMKLVGIFSLASGALLHLMLGSKHDHECELLRRLRNYFQPKDILLADRGFCSFAEIAALLARGVDSLMRQHQRRAADFQAGRSLGPDDRLLEWTKLREPAQELHRGGVCRPA